MINYLMRTVLAQRRFLDLLLLCATSYILFTLYTLTNAPKSLNMALKPVRIINDNFVSEIKTQMNDKKQSVSYNNPEITTNWTKIIEIGAPFEIKKTIFPHQSNNSLFSSRNTNEFKRNQQTKVGHFNHTLSKRDFSANAVQQYTKKSSAIQKYPLNSLELKAYNTNLWRTSKTNKGFISNQIDFYKSYNFSGQKPMHLASSKRTNHSAPSKKSMILSKLFVPQKQYKSIKTNGSKYNSYSSSASNNTGNSFKNDDTAVQNFLSESHKSMRQASSSGRSNINTINQKPNETLGRPLVIIDPEKDYKIFWGSVRVVSISYEANRDYFTQYHDSKGVDDIIPIIPVH